jgi:hypothetical protein
VSVPPALSFEERREGSTPDMQARLDQRIPDAWHHWHELERFRHEQLVRDSGALPAGARRNRRRSGARSVKIREVAAVGGSLHLGTIAETLCLAHSASWPGAFTGRPPARLRTSAYGALGARWTDRQWMSKLAPHFARAIIMTDMFTGGAIHEQSRVTE